MSTIEDPLQPVSSPPCFRLHTSATGAFGNEEALLGRTWALWRVGRGGLNMGEVVVVVFRDISFDYHGWAGELRGARVWVYLRVERGGRGEYCRL